MPTRIGILIPTITTEMNINANLMIRAANPQLASLSRINVRRTVLCGLLLGLGYGSPLHAEPTAPQTATSLTLTDWLNRGVSLAGTVVDTGHSLAYVPMDRTEDNDLAVFNFSSQALVHKGTVKGFGNNLFRYGSYLGSIQQEAGLVIWDMTIPMAPLQVTSLPGVYQGYFNHPVLDGNRLFHNYSGTMSVIDLGTPEAPNPQLLTSFYAGNMNEWVIAGGYLFGIGQSLGTYSLDVFDVRNTQQIIKVAGLQFESARLKSIGGSAMLAIMQNNRFLAISCRDENAIHVFDVANPANPIRLAGYVDTSGLPSSGRFSGIAKVDEGRFLMASEWYGVASYRISTSGGVSQESSLASVPNAYKVNTAGSFAFVTGWGDDLTLLSFTQPSLPKVIASSDPYPAHPELLVDALDVYTSRDDYRIDPDSGKLQQVQLGLTSMPLAVQDRILLIWKDGKLSLCRREVNNTLSTIGAIPLASATNAEFCGTLLRVFSNNQAYIYDCKIPSNPTYLGKVSATTELGSFPGCVNKDQALFSNFLAIRDAAGLVKIHDAYNLAKGPIQTVSNCGKLSRSRDLLFCNTPEGLKIIRSGPGGTVVVTNFPDLAPYSTWNISADSQTMAVWVTNQAKLFQIVRGSDYHISIHELGTDSIPSCGCHGGWYGRVADNFFFTNDAFAGISVLRMNNLPVPILTPEMVVESAEGVILNDGGNTRNFGTVPLGNRSTAETFVIKNTGTANLSGLAVTKNGAHAKDFIIASPARTSLAPDESTTFTVTFKPSAAGTRKAAIHIASNDADENPYDITLTGAGLATPEIAVQQPLGKSIADGGSRSFGNVTIGKSTSRFFTIKNTGTANLKNLAISINGANASNFTVTAPYKTALIPGGSTTFKVTVKPTAKGKRVAAIHIASNDANENPFDITLSGTGLTVSQSPSGIPGTGFATLQKQDQVTLETTTVTDMVDGLKYLALAVTKAPGTQHQPRTVEVSPNLIDWYSGGDHTTILRNDASLLKVRDNTPVTPGKKRYIRLQH